MSEAEDAAAAGKRAAALAALDLVESGMTLGLGTGSTAELFIAALGERVREGALDVKGVPTSEAAARAAQAAGVPLLSVDQVSSLDLDVDGADQVDPGFNLIKGRGGALFREKIIAAASKRMAVIVDRAKLVSALGDYPLPVEVDPFGWRITAGHVARALGAQARLRTAADGSVTWTDGGHLILDVLVGQITDPEATARKLSDIPGVIEHGLFIDLASVVIVGGDGSAEVLERKGR